jgi:hypothetical protein
MFYTNLVTQRILKLGLGSYNEHFDDTTTGNWNQHYFFSMFLPNFVGAKEYHNTEQDVWDWISQDGEIEHDVNFTIEQWVDGVLYTPPVGKETLVELEFSL